MTRISLAIAAAAALGGAGDAAAQPPLVSDLWRVAAATLVVPPALAHDGSAALWTPATLLEPGEASVRLGIETIHTPSDVGVNGGIATLAWRPGRFGTVNLVYGRLGVDGLVRTETSPEAIGGDIAAYAEVLSLGAARTVAPGLDVGLAVRALSGRLDVASQTQLGLDLGVRYSDRAHLTAGFASRFFDPTLRQGELAAAYSAALAYRTSRSAMLGTTGAVEFRYGAGWSRGEGAQHLVSAGLELGGVAEVDAGAAREETAGMAVWRSRFGVALEVGRYLVYLGRDGGVNGFGATYRFGLAATWR